MRLRLGLLFVALLSSSTAVAAGPQWSGLDQGWGGIIYAPLPRPALFVRATPAGIDALDARTGRRLWHSDKADEPILVRDGRLLAIGAGPVVLDAASGKVLRELPLPDPSSAAGCRFAEGVGFRSSGAGVTVGERDYLSCESSTYYAGGARLENPPPAESHSVLYLVDLAAGTATAASPGDVKAAEVAHQSLPSGATRVGPLGFPGGVQASLLVESGKQVVLQRTRDGAPLPDVVLVTLGTYNQLFGWLARDGQTVAGIGELHDFSTPSGDDDTGYGSDVFLYDPASGDRIGHVTLPHQLFGNFVVAGKVIVEFHGNDAQGFDLASGKALWKHAVRDVRYHGSYPP